MEFVLDHESTDNPGEHLVAERGSIYEDLTCFYQDLIEIYRTELDMIERLKKDKAKYKSAYTRTKTKLLMTMEGGMSSKMQVIERLNLVIQRDLVVKRAN